MMSEPNQHDRHFPVRFTIAQRIVIAEVLPEFAERMRLDESDQKVVALTLNEMSEIRKRVAPAIRRVDSGMKRNSLRHVLDITDKAVENFQGIGLIAVKERIYQLKVTLKGIKPPIWRRFQVRDCTLDKLHERIQTAMGWTNSHLHHFKIDGALYGDPWLLDENFVEMKYKNSRATMLSKILPKSGQRFQFDYEYDFGDSWWHEVLFEGCLRVTPGQRYPLCLEGERACPPEDSGGTSGYRKFLESLADPDDDQFEQCADWIGGVFRPEQFDPEKATKRMQRGLPDWRKMA
ncbi:MAG: plasmid pRiA4b ORF-3 family protein [Isosphaeraceae bacterium]